MSVCVIVCVCVCTCLFCLAVPTVLARERSPSPRTHPGGVCLCRLRGGHHQQNISDLQCSTGTVTPEGHASYWKSWRKKQHCIYMIRPSSSFSALLAFFGTFGTCLSSPWNWQQPVYSVTADLTHPTRMLACPFKLCRVIRFFNQAAELMPQSHTASGQFICLPKRVSSPKLKLNTVSHLH